MQKTQVIYSRDPKPKFLDSARLGFGQVFTDHMFTMKYDPDHGWYEPTVEPYRDLYLDPASMGFYYGQTVMEGMKAFRGPDAGIYMFRPRAFFERMNRSATQVCIPEFDVDQVMDGLKTLLTVDESWVPDSYGMSLYIRAAIIATDKRLQFGISSSYLFFIILSPSNQDYVNREHPASVWVESDYSRFVKGGIGEAKTPARYVQCLPAEKKAREKGFNWVMWLDSMDHRYIEEVGTMNVFFVADKTLITPKLHGSILHGVVRDSFLAMAREMGINVSESLVDINDIFDYYEKGLLTEAFVTNTEALMQPIADIHWKGRDIHLDYSGKKLISETISEELRSIVYRNGKDPFHWRYRIL